MLRGSWFAWLPLAGVLLSCGGGGGGVVRPKDFKGADALGAGATCAGAAKFARPLTIDLDSDTRGDLEASLGRSTRRRATPASVWRASTSAAVTAVTASFAIS